MLTNAQWAITEKTVWIMLHEIKIEEPYYIQVLSGAKTFEIRYNDRGYQAGDTVLMSVAGRVIPAIKAKIGYVTSFQQKDNFVVFSLLDVEREYD